MRNAELLNRVAGVIRETPEQYDHTYWIVTEAGSTRGCIGGLACLLSGFKPYKCKGEQYGLLPRIPQNHFHQIWDGSDIKTMTTVERLASKLYGLTTHEINVLFDPDWMPNNGHTVSQVLELLAVGMKLSSLTKEYPRIECAMILLEREEKQNENRQIENGVEHVVQRREPDPTISYGATAALRYADEDPDSDRSGARVRVEEEQFSTVQGDFRFRISTRGRTEVRSGRIPRTDRPRHGNHADNCELSLEEARVRERATSNA